jgi:hypothetical protein
MSRSSLSSSSGGSGGVPREALDHLNDTHRTLLTHYARFVRNRSDQQLKELDAVIDDTREMRLLESVYSHDDVVNILNGLKDVARSTLGEDLDKSTRQQALFLRLLLLSAEGYGVSLSVDTAQLDDA